MSYTKWSLNLDLELLNLGGESPVFIDIMGKSWSSDENNSSAHDCAI